MLMPVRANATEMLRKRNRTMPAMKAALGTVKVPPVYIFNVWTRTWGEGKYTIPACPEGEDHSEPLVIDGLVLSEYDLGDGGANMGTAVDAGMAVAQDIIGVNSTSPALDLFTTNREWFGVFATTNEQPTKKEIAAARAKLVRMMELIYAKGSELVQTGEKVPMLDRKNYNEAAAVLGLKQLWGNQEHVMSDCPLCREPIKDGAVFCKHCQQDISPEALADRESAKKSKVKAS